MIHKHGFDREEVQGGSSILLYLVLTEDGSTVEYLTYSWKTTVTDCNIISSSITTLLY